MSEKLEIGSIVEGKVVRLKPFGAIVSLGNSQGFVHISQVANGFVEDINDHLKVDDIVKVKVVSVDMENNKISLSIRDALPKPDKPSNNSNNNNNSNNSRPRKNTYAEKSDLPFKNQNKSYDFEDKMKDWLKQSTERQTTLNKRANKRS